jgi:hypothetical protein
MAKEALRENVRLAVASNGSKFVRPQSSWGSAMHTLLRVLGKGQVSLASLLPLPTSIVDDLYRRWQQHAWAGVQEAIGNTPCGIALYQPASSVLCIDHGFVVRCLRVVQVGFGVFICASRLGH